MFVAYFSIFYQNQKEKKTHRALNCILYIRSVNYIDINKILHGFLWQRERERESLFKIQNVCVTLIRKLNMYLFSK